MPSQNRFHGALCLVEGCGKPAICQFRCRSHYDRWRRTGTVEPQIQAKGSWSKTKQGYLENGSNGEKTQLHRYKAELALGKPLPDGAEVHHLNGDRTDNRPCNLVVCPNRAYHMLLESRQWFLGWDGPKPVPYGGLPKGAPLPRSERFKKLEV
jgi:HNH endonuclease